MKFLESRFTTLRVYLVLFFHVRSVLGWASVPTCLSSFHPSFIYKTGTAGQRRWRLGQVLQNCRGKAIKHGFFSKTFTFTACAPNWANRSKGVCFTLWVCLRPVWEGLFLMTPVYTHWFWFTKSWRKSAEACFAVLGWASRFLVWAHGWNFYSFPLF